MNSLIVIIIFLRLTMTRCSNFNNSLNETNFEFNIGICMSKFTENVTIFDFYFMFSNQSNFNSMMSTNNKSTYDSCSTNCCNQINSSKFCFL